MSKGWLEILANAATLFMCVVVSWAVLWHFALSPKRDGVPSGTRPSVASIGSTVGDLDALPATLAVSGRRMTAIAVVSSGCTACNDSVVFYKRLISLRRHFRDDAFDVLFVGRSGSADLRSFLGEHDIGLSHEAQAPPDFALRFRATPTLILVDSDSRVIARWVGLLDPDAERQVMSSLMWALSERPH
jgi:hypothetical protein